MSLKIPNQYISGFKIINEVPVDEIKKIASVVSTIPTGTGLKDFTQILATKFPQSNLHELSSTIYSLGSILLNFESSVDEISNALYRALLVKFNEGSDIKKFEGLEDKIKIILNNGDNLKSTFKAIELISDNKVIYKNSRVCSDIRLIFDENVKENKSNRKAVVIHNLKLETEEAGDLKNYYFSLDSQDLQKMKELINRAIIKDNQIKSDYPNIEFIEFTD